jgi:DNA-binding GntR family transcriptional regulator
MLDRKLPLWYQVAQSLRADILTHQDGGARRLPTEAALAAQYGVSVITVRQALKAIEDEGLITRRRRLGTFVNPDALAQRPLKLLGAVETVFAQQASEATELLERADAVPVPRELSGLFGAVDQVSFFRRLRREHGEPISYALNYVRPEHGRRIETAQLERAPMTQVLRRDLGVAMGRIENTVEARGATPEAARHLGCDLLSPILFFTGISYDRAGHVLDVAHIHYRGDRYKFAVGFEVTA